MTPVVALQPETEQHRGNPLGRRLLAEQEARGLGVVEMARLIGVSHSTLSGWMSKERLRLPMASRTAIHRALALPMKEINLLVSASRADEGLEEMPNDIWKIAAFLRLLDVDERDEIMDIVHSKIKRKRRASLSHG